MKHRTDQEIHDILGETYHCIDLDDYPYYVAELIADVTEQMVLNQMIADGSVFLPEGAGDD